MKASRRKKISKIANLYLKCYNKFGSGFGRGNIFNLPIITKNINGIDAIEAFDLFDTQGKKNPCREPEKLQAILLGKAALNFHIKNWAEGINDGVSRAKELQDDPELKFLPKWVWKAVIHSSMKLLQEKVDRFFADSKGICAFELTKNTASWACNTLTYYNKDRNKAVELALS
jgi:hypothetical protein